MTEDEILKLLELIDKAVEAEVDTDAFERIQEHADRNGLEDSLVAFATYFGA